MDGVKEIKTLLKACARNDPRAQEQLYQGCYPYGITVALYYSSNREEAEEILQDSFVKMFRTLAAGKEPKVLKPWFRKVIINTAIDYYRKKQDSWKIFRLLPRPITRNSAIETLNDEDFYQLLQHLPTAYRLVFSLLERQNDEQRVRELAAEQNNPSLYYLTSKTRNTYWVVQGQVGYTFRLGQRWRPWVGASISVGVQTHRFYESYLLHGGTLSRVVTIESQAPGLEDFAANVYPAFMGGVQYRLTNRFSAGVIGGYIPRGGDVALPLPGLELRVNF